MKVRTLHHGEQLPEGLVVPFPRLDPRWVWLACNPTPQAVLYGCDMQGMAQLIVLKALPDAPKSAITSLFVGVMRDLRQRGYEHFMTFLSASEASELKMVRMVQRLGGKLEPRSGYFASARIPLRSASGELARGEGQEDATDAPERLSEALAWVLSDRATVAGGRA